MLLEREPYHTKVEKANGERIGLRAGKPLGGVNHTIGLHRALWFPFDLDLSTAGLISAFVAFWAKNQDREVCY